MIELYSVKDVAKIFAQTESRLRYWIQSGFIWPSVRRGGQYLYTFEDLIQVRTAVELLDSGVSMQKVRKALSELRKELPEGISPSSKVRICSDGDEVVVMTDDIIYEARSKQVVMAFAVESLQNQIAEILPLRPDSNSDVQGNVAMSDGVCEAVVEGSDETVPEELPSAYQLYLHACAAEDNGADDTAEKYLRQCLALEESMAAAHTNLGNLLHKRGALKEARQSYETALIYEPDQPEARFNLGNLLAEMGKREMAIAELRHVCSRNPNFEDAHFNLGVLLSEVGGAAQARKHLKRYLSLDENSEWAERARSFLEESADLSGPVRQAASEPSAHEVMGQSGEEELLPTWGSVV